MKYCWLAILSAVVVCGAGCETLGTSRQTQAELDVAVKLQFKDIPWPAGFVFEPGKSYSHWKDAYRFCRLNFKGPDDVYSVARFYRKQMLIVDWQLDSETFDGGVKRLEFEKGDERAVVEISARGGKTYLKVEVR